MAGTFRLQIVTQEGVKLDQQVESLRAPGVEGNFGVRRGHAPMISELGIGRLIVREAGKQPALYACSGGICEVSEKGVVILADTVEAGPEINVERAKEAEQRARERLQRRMPDIDVHRAQIALARAINRLKAAQGGL
jgi:F-type H+-transporting ATPase subunit epsilon